MIKEKLKGIFGTKLAIVSTVIVLTWQILFFALGASIFKNMWNSSPAFPIVCGIFSILPLVFQIINLFVLKQNRLYKYLIAISVLFMIGYFCFFAFVLSKLSYFLIAGTPYFITIGIIAIIAFFIFVFPNCSKLAKKIVAISFVVITLLFSILFLFDCTPFYLENSATVFTVDDEYQIAFSTSHKSTGAIEISGKTYYDQTNGQNNISKLHKITVPAGELDRAKSYSIITQGVPVNTAYLPSKGSTIKKSYPFRAIDERDGIQIYNLSDTHECITGPANAGSWFGDKLDLLILNGDIVNDISSQGQIASIYKLAHKITGGSVPVIYTRGNHECNGSLANDFGKYVGCAERGFYYQVKIGSTLSMLVLDTNNDMSDNNHLLNPIANFNAIRKEESNWIRENSNWGDGFTHSFVISHMAYPLSGYLADSCPWHEWAKELINLTDKQTDLAICGHSHRTDFIEPNTEDNAVASFPVLRGSLRSNKYSDREGATPFEFTGTAIEIIGNNINIKYTNAKKVIMKEFNITK